MLRFYNLIAIWAIFVVGSHAELVTQILDSKIETGQRNLSDRYIITLRPGINLAEHLSEVDAKDLLRTDNEFEGVTHQYDFGSFRGYAGHFSASVIDSVKDHEDIAAIEADQPWHIDALTSQANAQPGLGLISHKEPTPQNVQRYIYDSTAGADTFAYVLDSGINIEHSEFQGRANLGYNAVNPRKQVWNDDFGHGTHVAGIIGSKTFGVSKRVQLIAVKVVQGRGQESFAQILDGYQWAVRDIASKRRAGKAVIHVSVYGPDTQAWTDAVKLASQQGITTVVPAGNQNTDPSRRLEPIRYDIITVSATDNQRKKAMFANWGASVDIFAPGVNVRSLWGHSETKVISGTAQSAAYVSGLVAYFKSMEPLLTHSETKMKVLRTGIRNIVQCLDGKKRFAYNGSGR